MTAETFRCADSSESRAEPLYGTASTVRRWLLLEQPGSWGRDALRESRLPPQVAEELRRRGRLHGVRVVLIRRGVRFTSERRQCYLAETTAQRSRLLCLGLEDPAGVLDVDLRTVWDGQMPDAQEGDAPMFLVCTHGRHDVCCSIRGNQVSRVACAKPGSEAWECSHIGGDRFAANVVCFPHGLYYGRVGPGDVAALMDDYARGVMSLDHYRGLCSSPFVVQAAEYYLRRQEGLVHIEDVKPLGAAEAGTDRVLARFVVRGHRSAEVEVQIATSPERYQLTCGATRQNVIPRYELIRCEVV